jgi:hypothetical protein
VTVLVLIGVMACAWAVYLAAAWRLDVRAQRRGPVPLATVSPRPVRLAPLPVPLDVERGRLNRYRRTQAQAGGARW